MGLDTVYEWLGWVLIALGTVGCFVPILPGPILAYGALFAALARGDHSQPARACLIAAGVLTVAVTVLDSIVPALGAKKFDCSKAGMTGCFVGTFVGMFFVPLGLILGPFLGALAGELIVGKAPNAALKGAFGALLGYFFGIILKLICCGAIGYWFYMAVRAA